MKPGRLFKRSGFSVFACSHIKSVRASPFLGVKCGKCLCEWQNFFIFYSHLGVFFLNMQYYFAEQGYFGGRERLDLLQI